MPLLSRLGHGATVCPSLPLLALVCHSLHVPILPVVCLSLHATSVPWCALVCHSLHAPTLETRDTVLYPALVCPYFPLCVP